MSPLPNLQTQRLSLDELREDDAPRLGEIRNDEETRRYLGPRPIEELEATRALIRTIRDNNAGGRAFNRAVRLRADGLLIGFAGVWRIDSEKKEGELGYMIAREHWNHGYATEAVTALLQSIDAELPGIRLVATVHHQHAASIRLLERFCFVVAPATGDEEPDCVRYERLSRGQRGKRLERGGPTTP